MAVIPGGILHRDDGARFVSPVGASVGGPVFAAKTSLADISAIIAALQDYAAAEVWAQIEMTIAPSIYQRTPSETLPFVLMQRGFSVREQRLSIAIPLQANQTNSFERLFRATSANEVRGARRRGVEVVEGGLELLSDFVPLWNETYERLGAQPTHTSDELLDLVTRFPDQARFFLARLEGQPIAATFVLLLNDVVAYSFYHVMSSKHSNANRQKAIFAHMTDRFGESSFRWLDLGPSASLHQTNEGVVFFKEGLGGVGHLRSTWTWTQF